VLHLYIAPMHAHRPHHKHRFPTRTYEVLTEAHAAPPTTLVLQLASLVTEMLEMPIGIQRKC
jgi:hypothetical protein